MRKRLRRLFTMILLVVIASGAVVVYLGYAEYQHLVQEAPLHDVVEKQRNKDDYVTIDAVNPIALEAMIATEDSRLLTRDSVLDWRALGRALWVNITSLELREGGSTIPQQVSKNLYLDHNTSFIRKVTEYFLTKDLLGNYTKEEILEIYLNIIYYGDNYFGISAASEGYFGVSPLDMNDGEATLLVGLPQSPANYELSKYYDRARIRQDHVLDRMIDQNYIDEAEKDAILGLEIRGGYE